jgi:hypothetical protein
VGVGIALLLLGGFLLGGVWSVWNSDSATGGRTTSQLVFAVFLLVAAGLATAAGILWLVG